MSCDLNQNIGSSAENQAKRHRDAFRKPGELPMQCYIGRTSDHNLLLEVILMVKGLSHPVFGFAVLLLLATLFFVAVAQVQAGGLACPASTNGARQGEAEQQEHATHQNHHQDTVGHAVHRHHVAFFSGAGSNVDQNHTNFTLGLEYAYRLSIWQNRLGIGVVAERVFADFSETLLAGNAIAHLGHGFKALVASGIVFAQEEHIVDAGPEETGHGEAAQSETVRELLIRTGVSKDFHVGNFSLTPTLNLDFINGSAVLVYGFSVGRGF